MEIGSLSLLGEFAVQAVFFGIGILAVYFIGMQCG